MKFVWILLATLAAVFSSSFTLDCICFEEFEPEKVGEEWICRGQKRHRVFSCGEEKPPDCKCYKNGHEIILNIGELSCSTRTQVYDDYECAPKDEWEKYYKKYPYKAICYADRK